jgi:hypothetical protein
MQKHFQMNGMDSTASLRLFLGILVGLLGACMVTLGILAYKRMSISPDLINSCKSLDKEIQQFLDQSNLAFVQKHFSVTFSLVGSVTHLVHRHASNPCYVAVWIASEKPPRPFLQDKQDSLFSIVSLESLPLSDQEQ